MSGAIAANRDKAAIALSVRFTREINGVTGPCGGDHVDADAAFAQAYKGRSG